MTKDLSNCCQAEAKDHLSIQYPDKTPEELRGKTNYFLCMNCGEPCNLSGEPTQKLGWEEEFDSLPRHYGKVVCGQDNPMMQQDSIKAFIRKVEKEAYERGRQDALNSILNQ